MILIEFSYKIYHIAGMFGGGKAGKFGESSMIFARLKPSILVLTINLLADLLIRQTFFRQILQFAKLSRYMVAIPWQKPYCKPFKILLTSKCFSLCWKQL